MTAHCQPFSWITSSHCTFSTAWTSHICWCHLIQHCLWLTILLWNCFQSKQANNISFKISIFLSIYELMEVSFLNLLVLTSWTVTTDEPSSVINFVSSSTVRWPFFSASRTSKAFWSWSSGRGLYLENIMHRDLTA